jgi:hypothetical protein
VDIRHAGVTTGSRDDVVRRDRSVWCVDGWECWWDTISEVLRRLLCLGLDANQSIQWKYESDVSPLLFALIDDKFTEYISEKVRILLEVGAEVNVIVKYTEYEPRLPRRSVLDWVRYKLYRVDSRARYQKCNSVLDREGVSVIERVKRLVCENS